MDLVHDLNKEKANLKGERNKLSEVGCGKCLGSGRPFAPPPTAMGGSPEKEK